MSGTAGAEVMLQEIDRLAADLPLLVDAAFSLHDTAFCRSFDQILLTGCGDSLQAAEAVAPVFAAHTGWRVSVVGPRRLIAGFDNGSDPERLQGKGMLVIGVTASGGTPAVCEALQKARAAGAVTLAVVGRARSRATAIAHDCLSLSLAPAASGPGIRTYQASLVGLLALAVRLGMVAGRLPSGSARRWTQLLLGLVAPLQETIESAKPFAGRIAQQTAEFPVMFFLGAGQHLATARYAAAKRVEASGLYAVGQDLEEAWHIERFASPRDLPVGVIAPPGSSAAEAAIACLNARGLGRRVFALTDPQDRSIRRHAHVALDLAPVPLEILAPLLCHPVFTLVMAHEAVLLGQQPFRADTPEIAADLAAYRTWADSG